MMFSSNKIFFYFSFSLVLMLKWFNWVINITSIEHHTVSGLTTWWQLLFRKKKKKKYYWRYKKLFFCFTQRNFLHVSRSLANDFFFFWEILKIYNLTATTTNQPLRFAHKKNAKYLFEKKKKNWTQIYRKYRALASNRSKQEERKKERESV